MENISQEELNERIALLKKFRSLLQQQRDKFKEYLNVLEKQETSIQNEDTEALMAHTELEQQVVSNIMNLQKVIVPMSEIYNKRGNGMEEASVKEIKGDLDKLQVKVLAQNEKNRALLKSHMTQLREQIASLKNPYKTSRSIYAEKSHVGTMVAVNA